jgi:hypothetical protein
MDCGAIGHEFERGRDVCVWWSAATVVSCPPGALGETECDQPQISSNEIPTGSPDDAVAEVGHAWGLEHADELELGFVRLEAV